MDWLLSLLTALQSMSPLAIIALLGVIILLLVRNKQEVTASVSDIKENDLHHLPEILATLQRIEVKLSEEFSWIRAKLNGGL